jgi:cysteine desulfurase
MVYLDCNATTPIEPAIIREMEQCLTVDYGNAASRTHEFGLRAKQIVERARHRVAAVVKARPEEIVFTSGATESNNISLFGLVPYAEETGKKHIVSTQIEHKAVLEPLEILKKRGFEITLVAPNSLGWVDPEAVAAAVKTDTLLVSVMHVNNETGVIQSISEIAARLKNHPAFFHVDAAQGFGKEFETLQDPRIDLISISGHKIYGPKGIGALVARRRGFNRLPLTPIMFGGGQEGGLRPGTLPVQLIAGLGLAAELALTNCAARRQACETYRRSVLSGLLPLQFELNADQSRTMPHVLNLGLPGIDAEALMVALKNLIAVSNGSACTSQRYELSHVLKAMGFSDARIKNSIRISWCHMSEPANWEAVVRAVRRLV